MKTILKNIGADFPASVVVFLIALPLCLGIALGSGTPLFSGLIAGIIGGIVIGSLSGSHLSVSGPAAGLTAIVATAVGKMPAFEAFLLSVSIAGAIQLILGVVKAGVFGDYIPSSVIKGMLTAIGIILILKQIPHLVGYDKDFEGDYAFEQGDKDNTFSGITGALERLTPLAVIIGVVCLLVQIIWDKVLYKKARFFQLFPAPLVVVLTGVLINYFFLNDSTLSLKEEHMVSIPVAKSASEFVSFFTMPDFSYINLPIVWTTGLTLAIVASLETLLNIEAADNLDPYRRVTPTNRELKAQGIGNLVSGLVGGLPITSVVVRTSANLNAGAKSKMATVYHGILLLLCVAFIPSILDLIPLSALAAILIYTGYKLTKPSIFIELYKKGFNQFFPFLVTVVTIILTDLLIGISVGIIVGLFFIIRTNFKTSLLVVNDGGRYLFRFRKDISFLNKPLLKEKLEEVPPNSYVLIDITRADFIDQDVAGVINDFTKHASLKDIKVEVKSSQHRTSHQQIVPIKMTETEPEMVL